MVILYSPVAFSVHKRMLMYLPTFLALICRILLSCHVQTAFLSRPGWQRHSRVATVVGCVGVRRLKDGLVLEKWSIPRIERSSLHARNWSQWRFS